ncbi:hypothetical protein [Lysobacter antibioticus]|uniref:hypothetical protein n=1 Tax=Lysobacter antibioticus TaxID=84531 RepID=UPI001269C98E|nr:hypothetical protein [Lysobacter antibioticus]
MTGKAPKQIKITATATATATATTLSLADVGGFAFGFGEQCRRTEQHDWRTRFRGAWTAVQAILTAAGKWMGSICNPAYTDFGRMSPAT